ncbi:MAG: hypothetical protein ABL982_21545 [Vicinamibacterales bacterium]
MRKRLMVEFQDARLRETLAHCSPIIEGYEGRLDAASSDIKQLEAYLDGKVDGPVDIVLSETYSETRRGEADGVLANRVEGQIERLVFMRSAGRWRLMYVRSLATGHEEFGDSFSSWAVWNLETPVDRRPLIETPAETRLRAIKELPELVRAVARKFTIDPIEVDLPKSNFDEIPF